MKDEAVCRHHFVKNQELKPDSVICYFAENLQSASGHGNVK